MLKQFENWMINRGYKAFSVNGSPSTAIDYPWRISKICQREGYTLEQLAQNINHVLKEHEFGGEKYNTVGVKSHESYLNALRQFRKFILVQRFGGANG